METITILKGPDRVRKRPAVIFTSEDLEGAKEAIKPLLSLYATEAQLGHCRVLSVLQNGSQITVSGDDRGLRLSDGVDSRLWERIFCQLLPAPRADTVNREYIYDLIQGEHSFLFGDSPEKDQCILPKEISCLDLCALQCVCTYMEVTAVRDGVKHMLHFCRGYPQGALQKEMTQDQRGTTFTFALDPEVFTDTNIPQSFFCDALKNYAMLSPGLVCRYTNEATGEMHSYCFPSGIADYVQREAPICKFPVYYHRSAAEGREYSNRPGYRAEVEIAVGFAPTGGFCKCLHNFREISGGDHFSEAKRQICRNLEDCFCGEIHSDGRKQKGITEKELKDHLMLIVATKCSPYATVWSSGARKSIQNKMLVDMVANAVGPILSDYIRANRNTLLPIVNAIMEKRRETDIQSKDDPA